MRENSCLNTPRKLRNLYVEDTIKIKGIRNQLGIKKLTELSVIFKYGEYKII